MLNEATKDFIRKHQSDDVKKLSLQLKSKIDDKIDFINALIQIEGRQLIKNKIPAWYDNDRIIFPPKLALEQASSQITAKYKSSLFSGDSFVDLTGGFGVDFTFIAFGFKQATYVEKQENLEKIAAHNFRVLGLENVRTVNEDGIKYLEEMDPVDLIFIDPSRRSESGKKVVSIENCEPDISRIQSLLLEKAKTVLIKFSPLLDISMALNVLTQVSEVHIISIENECKELLLVQKQDFIGETLVFCLNFKRDGTNEKLIFPPFHRGKSLNINYTSAIGKYLYEPNSSILKSGYYNEIAEKFSIRKFHVNSHLYTSEELIADFPGRIFQVEEYSSLNKKDLKPFLENIPAANLTVRNFPLTVEALRKKLKIKEGGEIYLFATTLSNGNHILIRCRK